MPAVLQQAPGGPRGEGRHSVPRRHRGRGEPVELVVLGVVVAELVGAGVVSVPARLPGDAVEVLAEGEPSSGGRRMPGRRGRQGEAARGEVVEASGALVEAEHDVRAGAEGALPGGDGQPPRAYPYVVGRLGEVGVLPVPVAYRHAPCPDGDAAKTPAIRRTEFLHDFSSRGLACRPRRRMRLGEPINLPAVENLIRRREVCNARSCAIGSQNSTSAKASQTHKSQSACHGKPLQGTRLRVAGH